MRERVLKNSLNKLFLLYKYCLIYEKILAAKFIKKNAILNCRDVMDVSNFKMQRTDGWDELAFIRLFTKFVSNFFTEKPSLYYLG